MQPGYDIAIVGATGVVGEALLEILAERKFPIGDIYPLASERSVGATVMFDGKAKRVGNVADFDFSTVNFAFFSAGSDISKIYAPKAGDAGCIVIDNTSEFRYQTDVPLIIPEVNPEDISEYRNRNIIANPNCSTIQMLVALKPIYDAVGIDVINVATYQSVSGAGKSAIAELAKQTADLLNGHEANSSVFNKQIAFNVLPDIDVRMDNDYTKEEMKMLWETQKILHDTNIEVNPTAVRVPVFFGHSEAIHVTTMQPITKDQALELLSKAPGTSVIDGNDFPTAVSHGTNNNDVFVGRVRQSLTSSHGLNLWVVSDNIRKGAALNSIQIAELLIKEQHHLH